MMGCPRGTLPLLFKDGKKKLGGDDYKDIFQLEDSG